MERDNATNNIFNTSLDLITNRLKEILYLLDDITIVSKKSNSSNTLKLENDLNSITNNITKIFVECDLDEIRLTKFSMVIYHIVLSFLEFLKSNIKYGALADDTVIKVLNSDDNQIDKINNFIKSLQISIDRVSI
nr:hypothetical protein [uncultured Romboutsia sp.]